MKRFEKKLDEYYTNKYIECNEMFEKIFKEEKHIIILILITE